MNDTLFDRYREALRAGHVAVMRGRLEDAAIAYREAAQLAGNRTVPRTALGAVELRLGQPAEALASFDAALALDPADDAALGGRAQALVVLERPDDAAATFDLLADARRGAAKLAEACDALRHAMEIHASPERRERYLELVEELRQTGGDAAAERAAARAGRYLDIASDASDAPDAAQSADAETAAIANPEAGPPVDGGALVLAAEEAAARGDAPGAVAAAMAAARAFRAAGHPVAALDACVDALRFGPDNVDLHLLIASVAYERGAAAAAADTYRHLLRLV
jgi:tetratricopeptide (TPR) repeat protein